MKNRIEIKAEAKALIRTGRVNPLLMTLVVMAVAYLLDRVVTLAQTGHMFAAVPVDQLIRYMEAVAAQDAEAVMNAAMGLMTTLPRQGLIATFFSILVSLFTTVLYGGYYIYCMGIRQRLEMPYAALLDGMGVAGKLIWCSILMGIKIFLWSLLFWVPGIVAAYRYRFAIYNILTDGSLSAGQAIRLSCQQTRGMKGRLFVLDLSFIGWSILSLFTFGLLDIWLTPYKTLCDLAYFEEGQLNLGRSPYGGEAQSDAPGNDTPWEL